jgi:hypothetical protein
MPPEVAAQFQTQMAQEAARRDRFGNVRPLITLVDQDYRLIAVGSRIYHGKHWRTFTDFLIFYVKDVFGSDWWKEQVGKAAGERHPLLDWYDHIVKLGDILPRESDGLIAAAPDGVMSAYLLLAYDLYVLRDNGKLQNEVVERLRHRDQFPGARYELFVAATFIRAGLEFKYDDETDGSKKHPEFVATDVATGLVIAVEAKARQRMRKQPFDVAEIRPPVRDLLLSAVAKEPPHPLVTFLEVNLPPEDIGALPTWVSHVDEVVKEIAAGRGAHPFAAVIFTNRPHLYGLPAQTDPAKQFALILPTGSAVSLELAQKLVKAVTQYGNAPSKFPDEFGADPT